MVDLRVNENLIKVHDELIEIALLIAVAGARISLHRLLLIIECLISGLWNIGVEYVFHGYLVTQLNFIFGQSEVPGHIFRLRAIIFTAILLL